MTTFDSTVESLPDLLRSIGAGRTERALADYQRPVEQRDFRGYFRWPGRLSDRLYSHLYHGCHADELDEALKARELPLRSKWQLRLPEHGMWTVPGVWCGLNHF